MLGSDDEQFFTLSQSSITESEIGVKDGDQVRFGNMSITNTNLLNIN